MSARIYKYPLESEEVQFLALPVKARILSAGYEESQLYVWALVDTTAPTIYRKFCISYVGFEADHLTDMMLVSHIPAPGLDLFVFVDREAPTP